MFGFFRKRRKYPIKYDEYGRSARERAFNLLDLGKTYEDVSVEVDINLETARRYYYQWKKLPRNLKNSVRLLKQILKSDPEAMKEMLNDLAQATGTTVDEVLSEIQQPHAFKRLVLGYWVKKIRISQCLNTLYRLKAAANIVFLYGYLGIPPKKILEALDKLREEYAPE